MSYKPGDTYIGEFTTQRFDTGAATDADSLPTATMAHNGTDDGSVTLTVTNIDTGRYKVSGTIPGSGYTIGDKVQIAVAATVNSVAGKEIIDSFVLDSKRVGDLNLRDDVGYPVVVAILAADNQDLTSNLDVYLRWREQIARYFRNQSLSGVPEIYTCRIEPQSIVLPAAFDSMEWASFLLFRFISREPRGAGTWS